MKKALVLLFFLAVISLNFIDLTYQSVSTSNLDEIETKVEKYIWKENEFELKISIDYADADWLIYFGRLLGHFPSAESGTSCFGACHNVAKGGHPDEPLPSGGSDWRRLKNEAYKLILSDTIDMPFDRPMKDSPSFVDNCNDTTILWEAFPSDFPNEEQGRRGFGGHDTEALVYTVKNEYILRELHYLAYGHYDITRESSICAISAYEQSVISSESNTSKGIVTKERGFLLFDTNCYSCHAPRKPAITSEAIALGDHEFVKSPQLTAWIFSPCDFNICVEYPIYKNRTWEVIKAHKPVYPQLAELTYQDARSIESFIVSDLTDHNLKRYK